MKRLFIGCLSLGCFMALSMAAQALQLNSDAARAINQLTSYDPGESPVTVTGQVRQVGGDQAAGVTIRFWQPDTPYKFITTKTDQQGRYDIELGPGLWSGEACGSAAYLPVAWQVLIDGDRIKRLESIQQKNIRIDSISQSEFNRHDAVTLTLRGQGFGCSGRVRVVFYESMDRCGEILPPEYDRDVIEISEFDQRTDTLLRFQPLDWGDGDVQQNRVSLFYQQAGQRSNAVAVTEYVLSDRFNDNAIICGGADVTVGNETSSGVSAELVGMGVTVNPGSLRGNSAINGALGSAADNPTNEGAGGALRTLDATLGSGVELEVEFENLNLEGMKSFEGIDVEGLNQ